VSRRKTVVLIVEDDAATASALEQMLRPTHDVVTAASAEEAQAALPGAAPSAALVDLGLPGMDGRALIQWMATQPKLRDIPVLIVSAGPAILPGNAVAFLRKPVNTAELLARLQRYQRA
jgi:CheY-like chemotaxis protein